MKVGDQSGQLNRLEEKNHGGGSKLQSIASEQKRLDYRFGLQKLKPRLLPIHPTISAFKSLLFQGTRLTTLHRKCHKIINDRLHPKTLLIVAKRVQTFQSST